MADNTTAEEFAKVLNRLEEANKRFVEIRAKLAETTASLENRALLARRQAEDFRERDWAA